MKKRILHLTTVHPGQDNRIYFKYLLGLHETNKYELEYLCPEKGVPISDKIKIKILKFKGSDLFTRFLTNIEAFVFCLKNKFHIIHFHDPEFLPFAILLSLLGEKVVYDVHEDYLKAIELKKLNFFVKILVKYSIKNMEAIFDKYFYTVIAEKCYKYRFPNSIQVLNFFKDIDLVELKDEKFTFDTINNLIYTGSISAERGAYEHVRLLDYSSEINIYMIGKCTNELAKDLYRYCGKNSNRLHIISNEIGINFNDILKYYYNNEWIFGLALFPFSDHYYEKELTKFFEYFYFDIVPLAANFPTWSALFNEANFGYILVDFENFHNILKSRLGSDLSFVDKDKYTWKSQLENIIYLYEII